MGLRFIFMLTRNDKTVVRAQTHLETALAAGVHHIGFKDVGLPVSALTELNAAIKAGGATSYLEVVSLDQASEVESARAAVAFGVDILLGGTHVDEVLPVLAGSGVRYYPFPGRISGHPSVLEGGIDEVVRSAQDITNKPGVDGLDLLAYRSRQNVPELMKAVCAATEKPVIMAGSIRSREHISVVKEVGAAGFTIGTAALDGEYPADGPELASQLRAIMKDVAQVNDHISPFPKMNLDQSFSDIDHPWQSSLAGQVNDMQIRLARFEGDYVWHYQPAKDTAFFVHKGRLMMKFRDRDEVVEQGEFIVVPHGVEHCPVAMSQTCEVVLLGPGPGDEHG